MRHACFTCRNRMQLAAARGPPSTRPSLCHPLMCLFTCTHSAPQECVAGSIMGGGLGLLILAFSSVWSGLDAQVGLTVAVALPVSLACYCAVLPVCVAGSGWECGC